MAGGTHAGGVSEINWVEKYIERLGEDMQNINRELKEIRGMEARINSRMDTRINSMQDNFNGKFDEVSRHMNNLVLAMTLGIGVAVVSAVIAVVSVLRAN